MRVHAALADQPKLGQLLQECCTDLGSLADKHNDLSVAKPVCKRVYLLNVIVPDRDLVAIELSEGVQGPNRIKVVVQDRDLHGRSARSGVEPPPRLAVGARLVG